MTTMATIRAAVEGHLLGMLFKDREIQADLSHALGRRVPLLVRSVRPSQMFTFTQRWRLWGEYVSDGRIKRQCIALVREGCAVDESVYGDGWKIGWSRYHWQL